MTIARHAAAQPLFLIGMPRSGTTLVFAAIAFHRDLGWFSQYMDRFPRLVPLAALNRLLEARPSTRKGVLRYGEARTLGERMRIAPSEAYDVWSRCCGDDFVYDFLLGVEADPRSRERARRQVARTLSLQGKPRFAAKLTGPARIGYLSGIFPDARFVHVVRDPRSVTESLLRVPFWRDTFRLDSPAWRNGLSEEDLAAWHRHDTPEALAAVEWGAVLRTAREEAARHAEGRYLEIRFEDFVGDPHANLDRMFSFAGLDPDPGAHEALDRRLEIRDTSSIWKENLSPEQVAIVEELLAGEIRELGYGPG